MDRREEMQALRSKQARLSRFESEIDSLLDEIAARSRERGANSARWDMLVAGLKAFREDTENRLQECRQGIRDVRRVDVTSKATSTTQAIRGEDKPFVSPATRRIEPVIDVHQQYLERIVFLEEQREKHQAMVERVRALLSKADARRLGEPGQARHWNSVVDNLEESLIESKARLELCDVEMARTQKELELLERSPEMQTARLPLPEALRGPMEPVAMGGLSATEKLLSMSLDEIGNMSLEEVARLHELVATENAEACVLDVDQLAQYMGDEKPAYAVEVPSPIMPDDSLTKQHHLKNAMGKIREHRAEFLNDEETIAFLEAYPALIKSLGNSPKEQSLSRVLHAAVITLKKRIK